MRLSDSVAASGPPHELIDDRDTVAANDRRRCVRHCQHLHRHSPVFRVRGEQVSLQESKGGHRVAQNVGAPHEGKPVVEDDGGRKPVEMVGVGNPQSMSDEPTLQAVNLILVH